MIPPYFSVKEAVFPFIKFPGVDTILGPEMKSTGEVMGVGETFAEAFVKSQLAAGVRLPKGGKAFLTVRDGDKARARRHRARARRAGLLARGHARHGGGARGRGPQGAAGQQGAEGRPHIVDMIKNGEVSLIVNTVEEDRRSIQDSWSIRNTALQNRITYYTTLVGRPRRLPGHAAPAGNARLRHPVAPRHNYHK